MGIYRRTDLSLDDRALWLNPNVAGWISYHGRYYPRSIPPQARQRLPEPLAGRKYMRLGTDKRFRGW
jgi:hypothetical protein